VQSRSLARTVTPADTVVSIWTFRSPKTKFAAEAEVEKRKAEANAAATV
jgi:hypothetical protein